MILMPFIYNGCFVYLLLLTTFIFHQLCESKELKVKRKAKEPFDFISRYYQLSKFDPHLFLGLKNKYKVRLYSKASESNLRILNQRQIDSLGTMNSADSVLIIETVAFGVIRIRGETSGLYLCMNKNGHLVARETLMSSKCAFIVEDDHPETYKRYVSLAFKPFRIAFNKNGRPRTATRVPNREHRSVLFVERRLYKEPVNFSMRTRRHGQRKVQDPCREANRFLLSDDWLKFWKEYCAKRKPSSRQTGTPSKR